MLFDEKEEELPVVKVSGIRSRSGAKADRSKALEDKIETLILKLDRHFKEENVVQITYPKEGGYKTIPAGSSASVIDFYTGDVILADGTKDELETSLQTESSEYIRSLSIESSENITLRFDRKNRVPVTYGRIVRFKHIRVRVIEIFAAVGTGIKIWASTKPEGAIEEISMDRVVVAEKQIPYKVFQVDLSQAHTDAPVGMTKLANSLTVLDAPSSFSYKLNNPANDMIPAEKGQSYNGIVFSEIYVTNLAASGTAKIHAAWVD